MIVIRTAEDMAHALDSPLPEDLKHLLTEHRDQLAEYSDYSLEELALFVIVEPQDCVADIAKACPTPLPDPEVVRQHVHWIEAAFILSDDGFGMVLFLPSEMGLSADIAALRQHWLEQAAYPANN